MLCLPRRIIRCSASRCAPPCTSRACCWPRTSRASTARRTGPVVTGVPSTTSNMQRRVCVDAKMEKKPRVVEISRSLIGSALAFAVADLTRQAALASVVRTADMAGGIDESLKALQAFPRAPELGLLVDDLLEGGSVALHIDSNPDFKASADGWKIRYP